MDYKTFFSRKAEEVAQDLLGYFAIRKNDSGIFAAVITETAAYRGGKITPARQGMLYEPGRIFLMPNRGHLLLNIACQGDMPACVELREISFPFALASPPNFPRPRRTINGAGTLSKFLELDAQMDNTLLGDAFSISDTKYKTGMTSRIDTTLEDQADNLIGVYRFS